MSFFRKTSLYDNKKLKKLFCHPRLMRDHSCQSLTQPEVCKYFLFYILKLPCTPQIITVPDDFSGFLPFCLSAFLFFCFFTFLIFCFYGNLAKNKIYSFCLIRYYMFAIKGIETLTCVAWKLLFDVCDLYFLSCFIFRLWLSEIKFSSHQLHLNFVMIKS